MPRRDYQKNNNHALLFTNNRRENENDPQFQGHGEIECPACGHVGRFWLKGWRKVSQKAGDFVSMTFRSKEGSMRRAAEDEGLSF